jgi:hypothetical protein
MPKLIINRVNKNVPGEDIVRQAVIASGDDITVTDVEGDTKEKTVTYSGEIHRLRDVLVQLVALVGGKVSDWSIDPAGDETVGAGADSIYEVVVSIPDETLDKLSDNGYYLYGFKAVQARGNGKPVVWFRTDNYSQSTAVEWSEKYQVYTSKSAIVPNGTITASNSYPVKLGQTLEVTGAQGTGDVVDGEIPGAISIQSMIDKEYTCGISQKVGAKVETLCAFPLFSNFEVAIAPIQKVMLLFATDVMDTGTVLIKSASQSVMVDLTTANQRSIGFDLSQGGWVTGGKSWATVYPPRTDLTGLLVEQPQQVPGARGVQRSLIGTGPHALLS